MSGEWMYGLGMVWIASMQCIASGTSVYTYVRVQKISSTGSFRQHFSEVPFMA